MAGEHGSEVQSDERRGLGQGADAYSQLRVESESGAANGATTERGTSPYKNWSDFYGDVADTIERHDKNYGSGLKGYTQLERGSAEQLVQLIRAHAEGTIGTGFTDSREEEDVLRQQVQPAINDALFNAAQRLMNPRSNSESYTGGVDTTPVTLYEHNYLDPATNSTTDPAARRSNPLVYTISTELERVLGAQPNEDVSRISSPDRTAVIESTRADTALPGYQLVYTTEQTVNGHDGPPVDRLTISLQRSAESEAVEPSVH